MVLTRRLKSLPETAEIPIICVSSYSGDHNKREVLAAGCVDVFTKSTFIESFRPTLDIYLGPPCTTRRG